MIAKLVQVSLKYKLLMVILFLTVCGAGVLSFTRLSIDAFPDISPNKIGCRHRDPLGLNDSPNPYLSQEDIQQSTVEDT